MVLGVNDEKGKCPNLSLMHYAIDSDLNIYFGTRKSFGKYQLLKKSPNVSFVVVEEGIDPLRVADMHGVAHELDGGEARLAYSLFKTENQAKWYVEGTDDFVMFRITPTSIRWLDGSSGALVMTEVPCPPRA